MTISEWTESAKSPYLDDDEGFFALDEKRFGGSYMPMSTVDRALSRSPRAYLIARGDNYRVDDRTRQRLHSISLEPPLNWSQPIVRRVSHAEYNATPAPSAGQGVAGFLQYTKTRIEANPDWIFVRTMYASTVLALAATISACAGFAIGSVFALSILLFIWGFTSLAVYGIVGRSSYDPRTGILLCVGGLGTALIALLQVFKV